MIKAVFGRSKEAHFSRSATSRTQGKGASGAPTILAQARSISRSASARLSAGQRPAKCRDCLRRLGGDDPVLARPGIHADHGPPGNRQSGLGEQAEVIAEPVQAEDSSPAQLAQFDHQLFH